MTEKRFVKGYHTIRDKKENKIYDFRIENVLSLLNTLHEENEQLTKEIEDLKEERDFYKGHCESEGLLYD